MRRPLLIFLLVLGLAALLWLGKAGADWAYFDDRDTLQQRIDAARSQVATYRKALDDQPRVRREIQAYVDRTLGGDLETVDHQLRSRLNRIAEEEGLADRLVGTGSASVQRSPARTSFSRRGVWAEMRDEIDFVELEGWISGAGTLAQVVRLVDRIQAEPWLKRVHELKLDPKDNGERIAVTLRLTTMFLPQREPSTAMQPSYDADRLARYASLMRSNPFRLPPKEQPAAAAPAPKADAPGFGWEQWVLTGLAQSSGGAEAWLRHRGTGETQVVQAGGRIGGASFEGIRGEWGVFRLEEERFFVQVGWDLSERRSEPG